MKRPKVLHSINAPTLPPGTPFIAPADTRTIECAGCGQAFRTTSRVARYCKDACRRADAKREKEGKTR